jgi:hypothetical protein
VPRTLEDIVMKCLAKQPEDRWPDAGALARRFGGIAVEPIR